MKSDLPIKPEVPIKKVKKERTQRKVVDESWSDERVQAFLDLRPVDGKHVDYFVLRKAYEYMVDSDFKRFVGFFIAAGRNINAVDASGRTILDRINQHQASVEYARILRDAGACLSVA